MQEQNTILSFAIPVYQLMHKHLKSVGEYLPLRVYDIVVSSPSDLKMKDETFTGFFLEFSSSAFRTEFCRKALFLELV